MKAEGNSTYGSIHNTYNYTIVMMSQCTMHRWYIKFIHLDIPPWWHVHCDIIGIVYYSLVFSKAVAAMDSVTVFFSVYNNENCMHYNKAGNVSMELHEVWQNLYGKFFHYWPLKAERYRQNAKLSTFIFCHVCVNITYNDVAVISTEAFRWRGP